MWYNDCTFVQSEAACRFALLSRDYTCDPRLGKKMPLARRFLSCAGGIMTAHSCGDIQEERNVFTVCFRKFGQREIPLAVQNIIEDSIRHPEKNYLVLVPEQFTMQTQKDLCLMHPRGGIMNIDVLSFGRLAHRVFEEVGRDSLPVLDDEGKNLVLRKIAGNFEDELTVLKGNLKKQGYISEVKSVISEFAQYGVDLERIDEFMEGMERDSYLYYKLKDIRRIYEGFEDYLREKYITKEEMLDVLSDVVPQSEILKHSVVAMDGFTGFTPVQDRLLGELLRVCDRVMITVEMDERKILLCTAIRTSSLLSASRWSPPL